MKLSADEEKGEFVISGRMPLAKVAADVSVRFIAMEEALDFARENNLDLTGDPMLFGYQLGGLAVQLSQGQLDEALVRQGIVYTTDPAWAESLRQLANIINAAADELQGGR